MQNLERLGFFKQWNCRRLLNASTDPLSTDAYKKASVFSPLFFDRLPQRHRQNVQSPDTPSMSLATVHYIPTSI